MTYYTKTPLLLRLLFPGLLWKYKAGEKNIYLTFDDGPVPEATIFVLDLLNEFSIKASFFCVGDNIKKHPEIFERLCREGHTVGNHTYNHLNGWKTPLASYVENVYKCREIIQSKGLTDTLFRPPHGRITLSEMKELSKDYRVVMWDVLSGDFDPELTAEDCLKNTIKATTDGSIVIFHDSIKAIEKVKAVLPSYIDHFRSRGYNFLPL